MLRLAATLGVTAWLTAVPAAAQVPAAHAGVLVGLRNDEGTGFRTLWLAPGNGAFAATEVAHLIVPRRTGFWRLGVAEACSQGQWEMQEPGWALFLTEYLFAVPVDLEPVVEVDSTQQPAGACRREPVVCEDRREARVEFVWPDYVSLDNRAVYECGVHPDAEVRYAVRSLDAVAERGLPLGDVLGLAATDAYVRAYRWAQQQHLAMWEDTGSCEVFDPDERNWRVVRDSARWRVRGWGDTHRLCGVGFDVPVEVALPAAIVGGSGGERGLPASLTRRVPDLVDAFWSPASELALGVTAGELLLLSRPLATEGTAPLLRVPLGPREAVVLVEWATGSQVDRWTRELTRIAARDFPAPRLVQSNP